jgi:hypothetical protein
MNREVKIKDREILSEKRGCCFLLCNTGEHIANPLKKVIGPTSAFSARRCRQIIYCRLVLYANDGIGRPQKKILKPP